MENAAAHKNTMDMNAKMCVTDTVVVSAHMLQKKVSSTLLHSLDYSTISKYFHTIQFNEKPQLASFNRQISRKRPKDYYLNTTHFFSCVFVST